MRSHALEAVQMLAVLVGTSLLWYALGRRMGLRADGVRPALRRLLEWTGLTVLFYAADVALGIALTLALRTTGFFVSMYGAADVAVLLLAAFQAYVVRSWMGAET